MALTKEQKVAILSENSEHKILLAGPGTGKSFTILGVIFFVYILGLLFLKIFKNFINYFFAFSTKRVHSTPLL